MHHKYSIRINLGKNASDLVRILPTATHTIAQVKSCRDNLAKSEALRLRSEWIAAGNVVPTLDSLSSFSKYRNKRAGCSKNVGSARATARAWKKINGKKGPASKKRRPAPPIPADQRARPKARPKPRARRPRGAAAVALVAR